MVLSRHGGASTPAALLGGALGRDVARRYLEMIRDAAQLVAANPQLARPLRGKLRILRVRSQYLIVHEDEQAKRLTVARVLHIEMDLERHLP